MIQQHGPLGMVTEPSAVYVALGDSISMDEYAGGAGRGGASLFACNRDEDFPEWRGRDLMAAGQDRPGSRRDLGRTVPGSCAAAPTAARAVTTTTRSRELPFSLQLVLICAITAGWPVLEMGMLIEGARG
jgi:hypothetical protein